MAEWTTPDAVHSFCGETEFEPASRSIDDNPGLYWYHPVVEYHWIIFDMGETKKITKIRVFQSYSNRIWGLDAGVTVYVGDNPADLGDAVWEGLMNGNPNTWNESGAFDKNGRYIKLLSKSNASTQRFYEFDAYAEAAGVAHEKTVTELLGLVDGHSYNKWTLHTKTVTEILGLVDGKAYVHKHYFTVTEILGLVDSWDKNRCPKCKPAVIVIF